MSWEGGVDLVAVTGAGATQPNVIVHVARQVHTPVGSAAAGMVLWQPDPSAPPAFVGFVSSDPAVGAYFGPKIFAGTPFEQAPVHQASIDITFDGAAASARVESGEFTFETTLSAIQAMEAVHREPAAMPPFAQLAIEAPAGSASLSVNGQSVVIMVPPVGITGGPAAVWSPSGIYCRP